MKTRLTLFANVAALSLLFACSKDNDAEPDGKNTELITSGSWKFNTATASGVNISGFFDACQKDNIISFRADGSAILDEGDSKCDPGDPQTLPFGWNFTGAESAIHVSTQLFEGGGTEFALEKLTASELEVSQNIDIGNGSTQKVTVSFIH